MEFCINQSLAKTYLNYGDRNKFRFYPETLITIVPRLFLKPTTTSCEYLFDLYQPSYKHGFCLSLNDDEFNRMYHKITKYQHVSNNCNRTVIKHDNDGTQNNLNINENNICSANNILQLNNCNYFQLIIDSLVLYE
eukprot:90272_1